MAEVAGWSNNQGATPKHLRRTYEFAAEYGLDAQFLQQNPEIFRENAIRALVQSGAYTDENWLAAQSDADLASLLAPENTSLRKEVAAGMVRSQEATGWNPFLAALNAQRKPTLYEALSKSSIGSY